MVVRRSAKPVMLPVSARSGADPAAADPAAGRSRVKNWHLLAGCCLVFLALAFLTHPGDIIADTKIDMAVNPVGFLRRALQLWDPAQFGQLQNQAVGYFFPMGPFFVAGKLLAVPGWIVQRLWLTAISAASFLGVVRLCSRLSIGTPGTGIAAGMAYALAPRALTLLGVNSGELLPAAMLPLVLIPVVRLMRHGQELGPAGRLRAAAQSAAALALCSGMNAASVAAVLTVAVIYVLTGERAWSRWRVLAWWAPAVILATCWWSVPLLLLGKYGVSLLPYTESAQVTTSVTSLSNILRGTEDWDAYLVVNGSPWWPVGYQIATGILPTLLTGLVAGLGLTGLLTRRLPERRFLLSALLAGFVIVGAGYVSSLGNPIANPVLHLINGPLAPLRNLRKFDPLIRLPVALGLAQLLATVRAPRPRASRSHTTRSGATQVQLSLSAARAVQLIAAAALALVALPAVTIGLSQAGAFPALPSYWVSAASWLTAHAGNQAVLEVPGARFGEYTWGRPLDDALEPLFTGDWASNQLSAIGSAGNTRLLDAIEQQLDAGQGSTGVTQLLAAMGVKYLVVRNDLDPGDLYGAFPARIHDALATSPGLVKVAQFGRHKVGNSFPDDAVSNFDSPYPPVEIYRVAGAAPVATVVPQADSVRVYGGPEAVLNLADEGLLDGRPVLLNSDGAGIPASDYVITDSLRRRLRNFGEIRIDYTQTLTARDSLSTFEAADDYLESSWLPDESLAVYHGIANVTASSSASDIQALPGQSATGSNPFAAIDGNSRTLWESGSLNGPVRQWLQVDFDHRIDPRVIHVAFADSVFVGPTVTRVTVQTSAGSLTENVRATSKSQALTVPPGATGWLRITVAAVASKQFPPPGSQVGITEVAVPGVTASRTIMAPAVRLPASARPSVLLAKAQPQPSACMRTSLRWVCSPFLSTPTEEQFGFDEGFTASAGSAAALRGQAIMTDTDSIRRDAWPGRDQPRVTASSVYTGDPQDMAAAAFDGSTATSWVAGPGDRHPVLTIRWHGVRTIRGITVNVPSGTSPAEVQVSDKAGIVGGGFTGRGGRLGFAKPVRTDELTLSFTPSSLPLQISNVSIPGVGPLHANPSAPVRLRCGLGPTLSLDGKLVPTSVQGTYADLLYGRSMTFTGCAAAKVTPGANTVVEPAADPTGWDVQSVLLSPAAATGGKITRTSADPESASKPGPASPATVLTWTDSSRTLRVSASQPSYLVVAENFNAGWQASIGGRSLRPVQLDGWEQAWLLPAGTHGVVTLTYGPDAVYRDALFGGLGLLALIIGIAIVPVRRRARGRRAGAGARSLAAAAPVPGGAGRKTGLMAWCAGLGVLVVLGLWVAGYPGAVLLPAATLVFVAAGRRAAADARGPGVAVSRVLYSRWLVAALVVVAAAGSAAGTRLLDTGGLTTAVTNSGPQLLCLVVVARIAAALERPGDISESPR
jgi:arabinofuranan 3-O-arabinosyltransferase